MASNEKAWSVGFKWTVGDASNPTGAIAVDTTSKALHIADIADIATDWNVAVDSDPTVYFHSATTPATDYIKVYHDATSGYLEVIGGTLDIRAVGSMVFNEASADVDFRIESNDNAYMFYIDGGKNSLVLGANTDVSSADHMVDIDRPTRTATASTNYADLWVEPTGAVTVPAGTTAVAASVYLAEPNITTSATLTTAATLHVASQPTEGSSNAGVSLADDVWLGLGTNTDQVIWNRASTLAANTLLAGAVIGTPVVAAIPANSLLISNVTANGDIAFLLNDTSGNSWEYDRFDGSAKVRVLNESGSDIDFRVEGDTATALFICDAGLDQVLINSPKGSGTAPLQITNSSDAAANVILRIDSDRATMADSDTAEIDFRLSDDGGNQTIVSKIFGIITDVTDTTEDGGFLFQVLSGGSVFTEPLRMLASAAGVLSTTFNENSADIDFRIEGDNNANMFVIDAGTDSMALGSAIVAGAFFAVDGSAVNRDIVTAVGYGQHLPAASFSFTNAASSTIALSARAYIGIPTLLGVEITQTHTDAATLMIGGVPAASTNMTITRAWSVYAPAGSAHFGGGINIGGPTSTNNLFDDASNGSGSTTMYIGNKAILVNNSINFGPAGVSSITVVGGQITAIS